MPPSTPCGNNLAKNHFWSPCDRIPRPHPTSATLIHKAKRYLSECDDEDSSGCADLGPIRPLWLNQMPAEIGDLSPLCSTCGYKEANPCSHCTLSFQFFLFFSVFKRAKDEVTMLQWMIHWEFMFWKLFPFACFLSGPFPI